MQRTVHKVAADSNTSSTTSATSSAAPSSSTPDSYDNPGADDQSGTGCCEQRYRTSADSGKYSDTNRLPTEIVRCHAGIPTERLSVQISADQHHRLRDELRETVGGFAGVRIPGCEVVRWAGSMA
ncbi:MAG: hypothetical protein ABI137_14950 [Antricoccus sp.]